VDGTLTENAFLKLRFSQEMSIVFAKLRPILKDLRRQTDNPDFMANMEKVILNSQLPQAASTGIAPPGRPAQDALMYSSHRLVEAICPYRETMRRLN
jgi:hypothetical protein